MNRSRNTGVALFTAIFLIVVLAAVGIAVTLLSTTQQLSSAQALDATRAYYAARARMEQEIDNAVGGGGCSGNGIQDVRGFTTVLQCASTTVEEGGDNYNVITMTVTAYRGSRDAGTRVRRVVRAQVTDL